VDTTLEQLDGDLWPAPEFESSLASTCHRLRRKPLDAFTVEDLRIMIGQRIGLAHLLPRAIDVLEQDPFAAGDFFPGDLLLAVLECAQASVASHELLERLLALAQRASGRSAETVDEVRTVVAAFSEWRERCSRDRLVSRG
jgi:hypothetical protein